MDKIVILKLSVQQGVKWKFPIKCKTNIKR